MARKYFVPKTLDIDMYEESTSQRDTREFHSVMRKVLTVIIFCVLVLMLVVSVI